MDIGEIGRVVGWWLLLLLGLALPSGLQGASLSVSNAPLFLGASVDPKVFFMVDNSACLHWKTVSSTGTRTGRRSCPCSHGSITAARSTFPPGTAGYGITRNLTGFAYPVAIDDHGFTDPRPAGPITSTMPGVDVDQHGRAAGETQQNIATWHPSLRRGLERVGRHDDHGGGPETLLAVNGHRGNPFGADPQKIDNLLPAACDRKDVFLVAPSPQEVVDSIQDTLANIPHRVGSSASLAANSDTLNAGSYL